MALLSRYASLASLAAAVCAPVYACFMPFGFDVVAVLIVIGALILWRHKSNIINLAAGKERKIGEKDVKGSEAEKS